MKYALAVHGGAGTILKSRMTRELEQEYLTGLHDALSAGEQILKTGGASMDAVVAAVCALENNPLFNAGKGSVFNSEGSHEMDAAVMNGMDLAAGAVCGVKGVKNPVLLARTVMEQTDHVLLSGTGAEKIARLHNLEFEPDEYFFSAQRYDQWKKVQGSSDTMLDHSDEKKFGTVGAVAIDENGNLAAATSTGGMTNKMFNRIGDTPLIGSGTYANNRTCAVSCTGHGEFFIRQVAAYDVSCLMEYGKFSLDEACNETVNRKLRDMGGEGGLIAIDHHGNISLVFNSEGMYRGSVRQGEERRVAIYGRS